MAAVEQLSGVYIEHPANEARALAVYVPGFGDTLAGSFGALLRRELLKNNIAVASVSSVDPVGDPMSALQTVPFSEQTGRVLGAIDRYANDLPVDVIGMSQGGFAPSEALPIVQENGVHEIGKWFAVNTPATGPTERLAAKMLTGKLIPDSVRDLGLTDVKGVIMGGEFPLVVSDEYWDEARLINPLQQLEEAYRYPNFSVVLASDDEVLNGQQHHMAEVFGTIDSGRVHVIEGANHHLTNEKGKYRRQVVSLIVGQLALPRG